MPTMTLPPNYPNFYPFIHASRHELSKHAYTVVDFESDLWRNYNELNGLGAWIYWYITTQCSGHVIHEIRDGTYGGRGSRFFFQIASEAHEMMAKTPNAEVLKKWSKCFIPMEKIDDNLTIKLAGALYLGHQAAITKETLPMLMWRVSQTKGNIYHHAPFLFFQEEDDLVAYKLKFE